MADEALLEPPSLSQLTSSEGWKNAPAEKRDKALDAWTKDVVTYGSKVHGWNPEQAKVVSDHVEDYRTKQNIPRMATPEQVEQIKKGIETNRALLTTSPLASFAASEEGKQIDRHEATAERVTQPLPSDTGKVNPLQSALESSGPFIDQIELSMKYASGDTPSEKLVNALVKDSGSATPFTDAADIMSGNKSPLTNPDEPILSIPEPTQKFIEKHPWIGGAGKGEADMVSALTTPRNIDMMMGISMLPEAPAKLVTLGFASQIAGQIGTDLGTLSAEKDPAKKAELAAKVISNGILETMMLNHVSAKDVVTPEQKAAAQADLENMIKERRQNRVSEDAQAVGLPATAEALKQPLPAPITEPKPEAQPVEANKGAGKPSNEKKETPQQQGTAPIEERAATEPDKTTGEKAGGEVQRVASTAIKAGDTIHTADDPTASHEDITTSKAKEGTDVTDGEKGFTDSAGNFMDRKKAAEVALASGQIDQPTYDRAMARDESKQQGLHSEDLQQTDTGRGTGEGPGAAAHSELDQPVKTSTKNATVAEEREARGEDPIEKEAKQSQPETVQTARQAMDSDPSKAEKIIEALNSGKTNVRKISVQDEAILLLHKVDLMNERKAAEDILHDGTKTDEEHAAASAAWDLAEKKINEVDKATTASGSEWGKFGALRQRTMKADYSLEAIEQRFRKKVDRPLTSEESAHIKKQAEEIAALQKSLAESQKTAKEKADVEEALQNTIKQYQAENAARPKHAPEVLRQAKAIVDRWRAEADSVKNDIFTYLSSEGGALGGSKRKGNVFSDANKAEVAFIKKVALEVKATIGEYGLSAAERGAELNARMIEKFGDKIIPYLDKAKRLAEQMMAGEVKDKIARAIRSGTKKTEKTPVEITAQAKAEALAGEELSPSTVQAIVRAHIASGLRGDAVIKAAHESVKEAYPDATERDVRRAFVDYGKVSFPSRDELKVHERELKQIVKIQEDIDRITRDNLDPLKKGYQRDKANLEIRKLMQERNDLLKKRNIEPSPEKLATREQAKQTAIKNRIEQLDEQLRTGEKRERTPAQPDSPQTEQLKSERDAMQEKWNELEAEKNPKLSPEERYNAMRQKAIAKQLADVEERLKTGNFEKTPRPRPPEKDAKTISDYSKLQEKKRELEQYAEKARLAQRSAPQKLIDRVLKVPWHLATAVKIMGHGTVGMFTHAGGLVWRPTAAVEFWRNFGRQFPMWINKDYHDRLIYNLENHPKYNFWKEAGASIDPDKTYTDYGLYAKWLGKMSAGGQRGFDALKLVRLELNEKDWKGVSPEIKNDPEKSFEAAKQIAAINNKATGAIARGNEPLDQLARNPAANALFFAPKLYASRFTRVVLDPLKTIKTFAEMANDNRTGKPTVSGAEALAAKIKLKHAAEFAATLTAGLITNQAILTATGSSQKVNFTDPTKSDWLKFKGFGKEFMVDGGLLDPVRLIGQIVYGDLIKNHTKEEEFEGKGGFKGASTDLGKYVRGKFNPSVGLIVDSISGKDATGRTLPFSNKPSDKYHPKYTWAEWLSKQGPIPLSQGATVAYDEMRKKGLSHIQATQIIQGAVISAAGATGMHLGEDYPKETRKKGFSIKGRRKK